mmetsp:Transcript_39728/g.58951  ORF Transcript_39728/g.58951 Transcript_39728/m.58951 type:complete len:83 (-) Transcript_39728:738-986(-)
MIRRSKWIVVLVSPTHHRHSKINSSFERVPGGIYDCKHRPSSPQTSSNDESSVRGSQITVVSASASRNGRVTKITDIITQYY